jgi:hypothetical protein
MIRLGPEGNDPIDWPLPPLTDEEMMELSAIFTWNVTGKILTPAKEKTALKIVHPHPQAFVYAQRDGVPASPLFNGREAHDIVCGNCKGVLAEGVTPPHLKDFLPLVTVQAILRCPEASNLLPLKGTKPQGKKKRD